MNEKKGKRTITFAGHRNIFESKELLEKDVYDYLMQIAQEETGIYALSGGMGDFDTLCSAAVRRIKRDYPDLPVELVLVVPYMKQGLNTNKDYYEKRYDNVLIFSSRLECHPKRVITQRNQWMVDQSDILLTYVIREFGGARATVNYAMKKGKCEIIPFYKS